MSEVTKVVEVRKIDGGGIGVTFSDGRKTEYSAALLSSIKEVAQQPIAFRDRFWIEDSE